MQRSLRSFLSGLAAALLPGILFAAPGAPSNTVAYCGASQVVVSWATNATATDYLVMRAASSGGSYVQIGATNGSSFTDATVSNDVPYYYVVTSQSNGTPGASSAAVCGIGLRNNGSYALLNRLSGLAMNVATNALIDQQVFSNTNQVWKLAQVASYFFSVRTTDGRALTAPAASAQLVAANYIPSANQYWFFTATNGYVVGNSVQFQPQVIDDYNLSTNAGTVVGLWPANGGTNQQWTFAPVAAPQLVSVKLTNGAPVSQYSFVVTVNPGGLDTKVVCSVGTNVSYSSTVTNTIAATNAPVQLVINVPLVVDREPVVHGMISIQNILGSTSSGDMTCSSLRFELAMCRELGNWVGTPFVADCLRWVDANDDGLLDLAAQGGDPSSGTIATISGFIFNPMLNMVLSPSYNGPGNNQWLSYNTLNPFTGGRDGVLLPFDFNGDNIPDMFWAGSCPNQTPLPYSAFPCVSYGRSGMTTISILRCSTAFRLPENAWYPNYCRAVVGDVDHSGSPSIILSSGLKVALGLPYLPGAHLLYRRASLTNIQNGLEYSPPAGVMTFQEFNTPMFISNVGDDLGGLTSEWTSYAMAAGFTSTNGFKDIYAYDAPDGIYGVATVYRNDGEGGYTPLTTWAGLGSPGDESTFYGGANAVWADFNGDGLDDLLTAESSVDSSRMRILLNDGHGNFTNSNWVMPPNFFKASLAVADVFNHGRPDIVLTGAGSPSTNGTVWAPLVLRNDGNGVFTPLDFGLYPELTFAGDGGVALGDYDNDGRLDIAIAGTTNNSSGFLADANRAPAVYRNIMNIPATAPPTAPTNLISIVSTGRVDLRWGNASDDITPVISLTYNLRIGTNTLGTSICPPLSNVTNGWHKVAERGNLGHCLGTWYNLPPGTYYWSVQAIDGAFAGGAWAPEQTFTITNAAQPVVSIYSNTPGRITWPARFNAYNAEVSTNLPASSWTTNAPGLADTDNGHWRYTVTNTTISPAFLRVRK